MTPGDQAPTLTLPTLELCEQVLNMQKLDVNAGDFEQVALNVIKAKHEIADAIEHHRKAEAEALKGK